MARSESSPEKSSQEIMQEAMDMHTKHNHGDEEWLKDLDIPETIKGDILARMIGRGGDWLTFIEQLTGYKGDYRVLTQVSRN